MSSPAAWRSRRSPTRLLACSGPTRTHLASAVRGPPPTQSRSSSVPDPPVETTGDSWPRAEIYELALLERPVVPVADHEPVIVAVEAQDRGRAHVAGHAQLIPDTAAT
jgi:hypothetical protein